MARTLINFNNLADLIKTSARYYSGTLLDKYGRAFTTEEVEDIIKDVRRKFHPDMHKDAIIDLVKITIHIHEQRLNGLQP